SGRPSAVGARAAALSEVSRRGSERPGCPPAGLAGRSRPPALPPRGAHAGRSRRPADRNRGERGRAGRGRGRRTIRPEVDLASKRSTGSVPGVGAERAAPKLAVRRTSGDPRGALARRQPSGRDVGAGIRPAMTTSRGSRELVLPGSLAAHLAAGHPWIYRDHVPRNFDAPSGSWVKVRSGAWAGVALWDRTSPIALRVFARSAVPDEAFVERRLVDAWELRAPLREQGVTAFRVVYGEGDGLPGVVVYYAGHCVLVTCADCLDVLVAPLTKALMRSVGARSVLRRRGPGDVQVLAGEAPSRELVIEEHGGMRRLVDVFAGQKTGLFL